MSAAVAISPPSGNITHLQNACEVTCTDVDPNTDTGYDADNYPASPAVVAFFNIHRAGADALVSPRFSTNADGEGEWHSVIFPSAGTWTLDLVDSSDDSVLATAEVVVA